MVVAIGYEIGKRQRVEKVYFCIKSCVQEPSMYIDCKYNVRKAHHHSSIQVHFSGENFECQLWKGRNENCQNSNQEDILFAIQGSHPILVQEQNIN